MNIQNAKIQIANTLRAYLAKDETGNYRIPPMRQRPVFLIGPPGIGKTTAIGELPGKTLIIDVDRGADVLIGNEKIDIVRLDTKLKEMKDILTTLETGCEYDIAPVYREGFKSPYFTIAVAFADGRIFAA